MMTPVSFDAEAKLAVKLLSLLENEQTVLLNFQIDMMEHLLEVKSELLNELGNETRKRYQALADNGFEANESGMKNWLRRHTDVALQAAWMLFQDTLSHSKEANRVNGILVTKHFNRNQQMLNVLHGNAGGFYGSNGQATINSGMRGGIVA